MSKHGTSSCEMKALTIMSTTHDSWSVGGGQAIFVDWGDCPCEENKILVVVVTPSILKSAFSQRQPIGSRYNDVAVLPQRGPQIDS